MVYTPLACFPIARKNGLSEGHPTLKKMLIECFNAIGFFWHPRAPLGQLPPPGSPIGLGSKFRFFGNRTLAMEAFCHGLYTPGMFPYRPQKNGLLEGHTKVKKYFDVMF